jgi:hypothetical protein
VRDNQPCLHGVFLTKIDDQLPPVLSYLQVAMVGSGAWACAAMHIVAQNCAAFDEADEFVDDVRMWVYEEDWEVRLACVWGGGARGRCLAARAVTVCVWCVGG